MKCSDQNHARSWFSCKLSRNRNLLSALILGLFLLGGSALAQLEPCGNFEADGQSGYTQSDWFLAIAQWTNVGTQPAVPDYDGDGIVSVLDMTIQANCVPDLSHGLLGTFYGFEDGTSGQNIVFPRFFQSGTW